MNSLIPERTMSWAAGCLVALAVTSLTGQALADGPGLHGWVFGQDETGKFIGMVPNAKIEFRNEAGSVAKQASADARGQYKVQLAPGQYFYKVTAPGYKDEDAGRAVRLKQSQKREVFHFALTKGNTDPEHQPPDLPTVDVGRLSGRVFEKTPQGGVGVPGATISLRRVGARELIEVISREADQEGQHAGEYEVLLEAGTYRASVSADGFERLVDPQEIEVVADDDTTRDFVLRRYEPPPEVVAAQGIRGTVAVLKNGSLIPPPFPVRVDILTMRDRDVVHTTAPGDSRGAFSQATAPGAYRAVAVAPENGFRKAVSPPVFVFPGRYSHVKLILRPEKPDVEPTPTEFAIEVRVVDGRDAKPLDEALVRLRQKGQSISASSRQITNTDGVATYQAKTAGTYLALAEAKGYKAAGLEFQAGPGQPNSVKIALLPTTTPTPASRSIVVIVHEAEKKQPLAGATVVAYRDDLSLRQGTRKTTDDKGHVAINVEPGGYVVMAGAAGYRPERATVRVTDKEEYRVELTLSRSTLPTPGTVAVTGKVVYEPPAGMTGYALISGAAIQWKRTAPVPGLARTVTTDDLGQFRIDLREGTYTVNIKPPKQHFLPLTATVEVRQGMGPKDFKLKYRPVTPSPGLVDVGGYVVARDRDRLRAVSGSVVQWRRGDGGPAAAESDTTSRMGSYTVRLPAGAYEVTVTPPAPYQPLTEKVSVSEGMRGHNFTVTADGVTPAERLVDVTGIVEGTKPPSRTRIPLARAEVLWILPGKIAKATSGSDGRFGLRLPQGDYRVVAKAKGYNELDTKVSIRGDMPTVRLALVAAATQPDRPSSLTLAVRVVEQRMLNRRRVTTPVADAQVMILQRGQAVARGSSGRDGRYSTTLPPGSYDVKVTREGYVPGATSVSLASSSVQRDIVLRRSQETAPPDTKKMLTLRVVTQSPSTRPGILTTLQGVPQADITIMKDSSRIATGKTDNNGIYRASLVPGNYLVKVSGKLIRPAGATVTIGTSSLTRQITVQRATSERTLIRPRPTLKKRPN